jgi:hypothetical protein
MIFEFIIYLLGLIGCFILILIIPKIYKAHFEPVSFPKN